VSRDEKCPTTSRPQRKPFALRSYFARRVWHGVKNLRTTNSADG